MDKALSEMKELIERNRMIREEEKKWAADLDNFLLKYPEFWEFINLFGRNNKEVTK